jgi:nanoRNase/pAp phosphatase (c-di-AMP/oligoRNAs hydrolase)
MGDPIRIDALAALLRGAPDEVFLQPHNVPDPDAIASCAGLKWLLAQRGVASEIVYDREIEKADSLKMLEVFGIGMRPYSEVSTLGEEDWAVLVDGQKGAGNLTDMPTDEVAVIDHHEWQGDMGYRYADVRPEAGACSSIVAEYCFEAGLEPPKNVATALLFGIMKDTGGLTRGVSALDVDMFYKLFRLSDMALIREVNGSQLSLGDLGHYARAFDTVEVFGPIGFLSLDSPDDSLLGSASDIVLSLDKVDYVVAWSRRPAGVKISTRSANERLGAADLARAVTEGIGFGGGHSHMAGGFIPEDRLPRHARIDTLIKHRAILALERASGE